jgi:hypothetical protein
MAFLSRDLVALSTVDWQHAATVSPQLPKDPNHELSSPGNVTSTVKIFSLSPFPRDAAALVTPVHPPTLSVDGAAAVLAIPEHTELHAASADSPPGIPSPDTGRKIPSILRQQIQVLFSTPAESPLDAVCPSLLVLARTPTATTVDAYRARTPLQRARSHLRLLEVAPTVEILRYSLPSAMIPSALGLLMHELAVECDASVLPRVLEVLSVPGPVAETVPTEKRALIALAAALRLLQAQPSDPVREEPARDAAYAISLGLELLQGASAALAAELGPGARIRDSLLMLPVLHPLPDLRSAEVQTSDATISLIAAFSTLHSAQSLTRRQRAIDSLSALVATASSAPWLVAPLPASLLPVLAKTSATEVAVAISNDAELELLFALATEPCQDLLLPFAACLGANIDQESIFKPLGGLYPQADFQKLCEAHQSVCQHVSSFFTNVGTSGAVSARAGAARCIALGLIAAVSDIPEASHSVDAVFRALTSTLDNLHAEVVDTIPADARAAAAVHEAQSAVARAAVSLAAAVKVSALLSFGEQATVEALLAPEDGSEAATPLLEFPRPRDLVASAPLHTIVALLALDVHDGRIQVNSSRLSEALTTLLHCGSRGGATGLVSVSAIACLLTEAASAPPRQALSPTIPALFHLLFAALGRTEEEKAALVASLGAALLLVGDDAAALAEAFLASIPPLASMRTAAAAIAVARACHVDSHNDGAMTAWPLLVQLGVICSPSMLQQPQVFSARSLAQVLGLVLARPSVLQASRRPTSYAVDSAAISEALAPLVATRGAPLVDSFETTVFDVQARAAIASGTCPPGRRLSAALIALRLLADQSDAAVQFQEALLIALPVALAATAVTSLPQVAEITQVTAAHDFVIPLSAVTPQHASTILLSVAIQRASRTASPIFATLAPTFTPSSRVICRAAAVATTAPAIPMLCASALGSAECLEAAARACLTDTFADPVECLASPISSANCTPEVRMAMSEALLVAALLVSISDSGQVVNPTIGGDDDDDDAVPRALPHKDEPASGALTHLLSVPTAAAPSAFSPQAESLFDRVVAMHRCRLLYSAGAISVEQMLHLAAQPPHQLIAVLLSCWGVADPLRPVDFFERLPRLSLPSFINVVTAAASPLSEADDLLSVSALAALGVAKAVLAGAPVDVVLALTRPDHETDETHSSIVPGLCCVLVDATTARKTHLSAPYALAAAHVLASLAPSLPEPCGNLLLATAGLCTPATGHQFFPSQQASVTFPAPVSLKPSKEAFAKILAFAFSRFSSSFPPALARLLPSSAIAWAVTAEPSFAALQQVNAPDVTHLSQGLSRSIADREVFYNRLLSAVLGAAHGASAGCEADAVTIYDNLRPAICDLLSISPSEEDATGALPAPEVDIRTATVLAALPPMTRLIFASASQIPRPLLSASLSAARAMNSAPLPNWLQLGPHTLPTTDSDKESVCEFPQHLLDWGRETSAVDDAAVATATPLSSPQALARLCAVRDVAACCGDASSSLSLRRGLRGLAVAATLASTFELALPASGPEFAEFLNSISARLALDPSNVSECPTDLPEPPVLLFDLFALSLSVAQTSPNPDSILAPLSLLMLRVFSPNANSQSEAIAASVTTIRACIAKILAHRYVFSFAHSAAHSARTSKPAPPPPSIAAMVDAFAAATCNALLVTVLPTVNLSRAALACLSVLSAETGSQPLARHVAHCLRLEPALSPHGVAASAVLAACESPGAEALSSLFCAAHVAPGNAAAALAFLADIPADAQFVSCPDATSDSPSEVPLIVLSRCATATSLDTDEGSAESGREASANSVGDAPDSPRPLISTDTAATVLERVCLHHLVYAGALAWSNPLAPSTEALSVDKELDDAIDRRAAADHAIAALFAPESPLRLLPAASLAHLAVAVAQAPVHAISLPFRLRLLHHALQTAAAHSSTTACVDSATLHELIFARTRVRALSRALCDPAVSSALTVRHACLLLASDAPLHLQCITELALASHRTPAVTRLCAALAATEAEADDFLSTAPLVVALPRELEDDLDHIMPANIPYGGRFLSGSHLARRVEVAKARGATPSGVHSHPPSSPGGPGSARRHRRPPPGPPAATPPPRLGAPGAPCVSGLAEACKAGVGAPHLPFVELSPAAAYASAGTRLAARLAQVASAGADLHLLPRISPAYDIACALLASASRQPDVSAVEALLSAWTTPALVSPPSAASAPLILALSQCLSPSASYAGARPDGAARVILRNASREGVTGAHPVAVAAVMGALVSRATLAVASASMLGCDIDSAATIPISSLMKTVVPAAISEGMLDASLFIQAFLAANLLANPISHCKLLAVAAGPFLLEAIAQPQSCHARDTVLDLIREVSELPASPTESTAACVIPSPEELASVVAESHDALCESRLTALSTVSMLISLASQRPGLLAVVAKSSQGPDLLLQTAALYDGCDDEGQLPFPTAPVSRSQLLMRATSALAAVSLQHAARAVLFSPASEVHALVRSLIVSRASGDVPIIRLVTGNPIESATTSADAPAGIVLISGPHAPESSLDCVVLPTLASDRQFCVDLEATRSTLPLLRLCRGLMVQGAVSDTPPATPTIFAALQHAIDTGARIASLPTTVGEILVIPAGMALAPSRVAALAVSLYGPEATAQTPVRSARTPLGTVAGGNGAGSSPTSKGFGSFLRRGTREVLSAFSQELGQSPK